MKNSSPVVEDEWGHEVEQADNGVLYVVGVFVFVRSSFEGTIVLSISSIIVVRTVGLQ